MMSPVMSTAAIGKIVYARATPVRVPAKPDSLNSESIDEASGTEKAFARKFKTGARWSEFPLQQKWIIELHARDGTCGIGETYRSATRPSVRKAMRKIL